MANTPNTRLSVILHPLKPLKPLFDILTRLVIVAAYPYYLALPQSQYLTRHLAQPSQSQISQTY